jgi:hypothetical protein
MIASGPMALTALCLLQASAEIEAAARAETRVGEVPSVGQGPMAMVVATPALGLNWSAGPESLHAVLSTRILWRPVPGLHSRPLFLETLGLTHVVRHSRRTEWNLNLRGSYGEQDYTSLSQQFANQPTLPLSTTMLMVEGAVGGLWHSSHRSTLAFAVRATHRRTLNGQTSSGDTAVLSDFTLPTQTTIGAIPAARFALSRLSSIGIAAPVTYWDSQASSSGATYRPAMNVFAVQPQLRAENQLSPHQRLYLAAGFTYANVIRGNTANLGPSITPLGQVDLHSALYRGRFTAVHAAVSTGTTWSVDPVLGRGAWRGFLQVGIDVLAGLRWGVGAHASFATDISEPPAVVNTAIDATMVSAGASVRYRWTNVLVAEFGGRYSERAPRLGSSDFAWHARELWAFATLYSATRAPLTTLHTTRSSGM